MDWSKFSTNRDEAFESWLRQLENSNLDGLQRDEDMGFKSGANWAFEYILDNLEALQKMEDSYGSRDNRDNTDTASQ